MAAKAGCMRSFNRGLGTDASIQESRLPPVDHGSGSAGSRYRRLFVPTFRHAVARKSHLNNLQASELSEPQFDLAND
jgi:hypothetical protein